MWENKSKVEFYKTLFCRLSPVMVFMVFLAVAINPYTAWYFPNSVMVQMEFNAEPVLVVLPKAVLVTLSLIYLLATVIVIYLRHYSAVKLRELGVDTESMRSSNFYD